MKKVAYGFLFVSLGLGLLVASIAVLVEASLVQISLHRDATDVKGFVQYRYYGIPVYWFRLDSLNRVEKRELKLADGSAEGGKTKRTKNVTRAVLLDSENKVIAWGERTGLVNAVEPLQKFLESDASDFEFEEKSVGHPWDIFRERVVRGLFSLTLLVGAILSLIGGVGQWLKLLMGRRSTRKNEPTVA
jgi:hypothetical protein